MKTNEAEPTISLRIPMVGTKLKIFTTALDLFATRGYDGVGLRDIASANNVKMASIYNHFKSKDDILDTIYTYFSDNYSVKTVDTRTLIEMAPNTPTEKIFELLLIPGGGEAEFDTMRRALSVIVQRQACDKRAAAIVAEIFYTGTEKIALVLNRLMELDLIKPVNVSLFSSVYISASLSAAILHGSEHTITHSRWRDGRMLLLQLVYKKQKQAVEAVFHR